MHQDGDLFELNVKLRCQKVKNICLAVYAEETKYAPVHLEQNAGNINIKTANKLRI